MAMTVEAYEASTKLAVFGGGSSGSTAGVAAATARRRIVWASLGLLVGIWIGVECSLSHLQSGLIAQATSDAASQVLAPENLSLDSLCASQIEEAKRSLLQAEELRILTLTQEKVGMQTDEKSTAEARECEQCADAVDDCTYWAASGECERNPGYMKNSCKVSCGLCNITCSQSTDSSVGKRYERFRALGRQENRENATFYVFDAQLLGERDCVWEDNCYHAEQWIPHQFFDRGWKRTERWEEAEIVWTSAADLGDVSALDRDQRSNHIKNVSTALGLKSEMHKTIIGYTATSGCPNPSFLPETFSLLDLQECRSLVTSLSTTKNKEKMWLYKPSAGSGGSGIRLMNHSEVESTVAGHTSLCTKESNETAVIQAYIDNPLLLQGLQRRKFNLRVYGLIASVVPFVLLGHTKGYISASSVSYNKSSTEVATHLTGMHTQMHALNYDPSKRVYSFGELEEFVYADKSAAQRLPVKLQNKEKGRFEEWLLDGLHKVMLTTLMSAKQSLPTTHPNNFNPVALDFLIDSNFGIHLCEVNPWPWMSWETANGRQFMSSVIAGIVDTVLQIRKKQTEDGDPWAKTITEPADWKILFHDAQPNFQLLKYGECYSS